MKILYTLNSGNPGGMEQHCVDLAKGMVLRGHKVFVWCVDGPVVDWFKQAGAQVRVKRILFEMDPVYIFELVSFLRKEKIDLIHGHELKAAANSIFAGFLARTKVRVSHIHTPISEWLMPTFIKKVYTYFAVFGYACEVNLFGSCEICLTESRKRIKSTEGISRSKLAVIPNGLDTTKFTVSPAQKVVYRNEILTRYNIPENAFVFGISSRLTEEKGHDILIRGFKKFLEFSILDKDNVYLLIAGGGRLEEQYKTLVKELGIQDRVIITGIFIAKDLIKFYNTWDAFVFPTRAEGFGIVLIEAMYSMIPTICSNLEVLEEVGGSTVLFFNVDDPDDLAQKMLSLYQRKDNLAELTQAAKKRVEDLFTMEKFDDAYETLYLKLLEEAK